MAALGYKSRVYRGPVGGLITDPITTKINKSVDIAPPTPSREKVAITNNDSPNFTREYIQGFIDTNQVTFNCIYEHGDADQNAILTDYYGGADTQSFWKIELHNNNTDALEKTITFPAFIGEASISLNTEERRELNVTLEVTGAVTIA